MGRLLNILKIFCVSLAVVSSLSHNETSGNSNSTLSKRSRSPIRSWGGRRSLRGHSYGTIRINIWNKTPNDLEDAKWKGQDLAVETPPPRTVSSCQNCNPPQDQAVEIVAHYRRQVMIFYQRTLWISYKISETHRICVYVKLKPRTINKFADPKFMYTVYITEMNDCDEPRSPPKKVFVSRNAGNGYKSYWKYVTAESALVSNILAHTLNIYILSVDENLPLKNGKLQAWKKISNTNQVKSENGASQGNLNNQVTAGISQSNEEPDIENQQSPSNQGNLNNQVTEGMSQSNEEPDFANQQSPNNQDNLNNQGTGEINPGNDQESDIANQQSPNNQGNLNNQGTGEINPGNQESDIENQHVPQRIDLTKLVAPDASNQQQSSTQPEGPPVGRGQMKTMKQRISNMSEESMRKMGEMFGKGATTETKMGEPNEAMREITAKMKQRRQGQTSENEGRPMNAGDKEENMHEIIR